MNIEAYRQWLRRFVEKYESQRAAAQDLGIFEQHISNVIHGLRKPTKSMLAATGFRKVVSYERVAKGTSK